MCLACVLVRLPWMFTVPMHAAPDEQTHFWVIEFMRDHLRLPDAAAVRSAGPVGVYGSLPQLGYLPHVIISKVFPDSQAPLFARFGSLLMGLVTVWAGFLTAVEIFPGSRLLIMALSAMLVFHPQLTFVQSYSNNDSTTCAVASVIVYLVVRCLKYGLSWKKTVALGVLCGWLALCKYSGYAMFPAAAAGFLAAGFLHGVSFSLLVAQCAAVAAIAAVVSLWWFVGNARQYGGDFLGTQTMFLTWAKANHKSLDYYKPPWEIVLQLRWWRMFYFSFWAVFGFMNLYIWRPLYLVFVGFLAASAVGWIREARRNVLTDKQPADIAAKSRLIESAIWSFMLLCCACNLTAMVLASTKNLGGPQGRYFFTSEVPFMALLISGLSRLHRKWGNVAVAALVMFTILVNVGCWFLLARLYGFHPNAY